MNWNKKIVVISGAGSGIGRALALELGNKGAFLALNDYHAANLEASIKLLPDSCQVFKAVFDVSDENAMQQFAQDVNAYFGRIDVLINNAGVAQEALFTEQINTKDFEWLLNINMWGTFYGCRAFLPYLKQQDNSCIANISSIFGMVGIPGVSSYSVSKFAVRGFSESLLLEQRIKKTGVHVCCVHPGGINTNIAQAARGASPKKMAAFQRNLKMPPSKAAQKILKGIEKKKVTLLVGTDAHIIYFLNKYAKKWLHRGIVRQFWKMK